ncbi:MAG: carboxylating nicotinate-nucleotide diphosphorylase [Proteobacteria bacterium]|nr:carboxylating nicotinate-nucleotide diphosphorylase [Pseudomonadota bacterium]
MSRQTLKFDDELKKICQAALEEDASEQDLTSDLTIADNTRVSFKITAREEIILCGVAAINHCFDSLTKLEKFKNIFLGLQVNAKDGDIIKAGEAIAEGFGDAKLIFAAERVILNLLQHLSGISSATNQFVKTLDNKKIKILDTRKTLPTLRILQKQAVVIGGGKNHRFNLSDMILIKDNHIAAAGGVKQAIMAAKQNKKVKIEVECDNFMQVVEAIPVKPDIIMLDNMSVVEIKKCTAKIRAYKSKKILIEISGGINLNKIKKFRLLDIDFISIGSLTHSVRAVDIGLDVI